MGSEAPIRFGCDACGKAYKVPASRAGRKTKCKGCGAVLTVPGPHSTPAPEEPEDDFIGLLDDDTPPKAARPKRPSKPTPKPRSADPTRAAGTGGASSKPKPSNTKSSKQQPTPKRRPDRSSRSAKQPRKPSSTSGRPAAASEPAAPGWDPTPPYAASGKSAPPPPPNEPTFRGPADDVFELAAPAQADLSRKPSRFPGYRAPKLPIAAGLGKLLSMGIALIIPAIIIGLVLIGVFVSPAHMLTLFGVLILVLGLLWGLLTTIEMLRVGFSELGGMMLLMFVPLLGFLVLLRFWDVLGGPFIRSILASLVMWFGGMCIIFGLIAIDGKDPVEVLASGQTDGAVQSGGGERPGHIMPRSGFGPGSPGWVRTPTPWSQRNSGGGRNTPAPPPPPPVPLLTAEDLKVAAPGLPTRAEDWPVFEPPEVESAAATSAGGGEVFAAMGYRLPLPPGISVLRLTRAEGGLDADIGGSVGSGRSVNVRLSIRPLARRDDGMPIVPNWREALAASGVVDIPRDLQHGTIGRLPFVRTATDTVATGSAVGQVVYVGLPGVDLPVRIVLSFNTHPHQNETALACEALIRGFGFAQPVMADPFDPATDDVTSPLPEPLPAGADPGRSPIAGMFAFPNTDDIQVRETSRGGELTISATTHPQRHGRIDMVLTPLDVPSSAVWPVQLEGPMRDWPDGMRRRHDSIVYAYGGAVSYVRLWDDAVFVRVDHEVHTFRHNHAEHAVSYYGFLGGYRVEIRITNDVAGRVPLSELERYLHATRLATASQIVELGRPGTWLREALGKAETDFPLAGGMRGADALTLDDFGRVAYSSRYDPVLHRLVRDFEVYPEMEPYDLDGYDRWEARRGSDQHLGGVVEMGAFRLRAITDLGRPVGNGETTLEWAVQTNAGNLGLSVELISLREQDMDLLTPLVEGGRPGQVQVRLGRRLLRPSEAPEVAYQETGGLRLWRIKMAPVRGMDAGRCYYAALVPGHMLVITATYSLNQPRQLDAFDAAVQSIDYRPMAAE